MGNNLYTADNSNKMVAAFMIDRIFVSSLGIERERDIKEIKLLWKEQSSILINSNFEYDRSKIIV